jgi:hypothetical protein
VTTWLVILEP